jgi:hypothetical protein
MDTRVKPEDDNEVAVTLCVAYAVASTMRSIAP